MDSRCCWLLAAVLVLGCSSADPGVESVPATSLQWKGFGNEGLLPTAAHRIARAKCALAAVGVLADGTYAVSTTPVCEGPPIDATGDFPTTPEGLRAQLASIDQGLDGLIAAVSALLGVYDLNIDDVLANDPGANVTLAEGSSDPVPVSRLLADAAVALAAARSDTARLASVEGLRGEGQKAQLVSMAVDAVAVRARVRALLVPCGPNGC